MAGATKQGSSRTATRSTTVGAASGNFGAQGNKLGFIRTAGSGKRKSITDPEVRDHTRQRMSTGDASSSAAAAASNNKGSILPPKGTLKASKLPSAPNRGGPTPNTAAEAMQGVEQPGGTIPDPANPATAREPGARVGGAGANTSGVDDIDVSDLGRDLQAVVKILQRTFEEKMDEVKESLGGRVSKLEEKVGRVEERINERESQIDTLAEKVDMIPVDIQRCVASAVAKETQSLAQGFA